MKHAYYCRSLVVPGIYNESMDLLNRSSSNELREDTDD